jgi:enterochelin esterase-like enzyme
VEKLVSMSKSSLILSTLLFLWSLSLAQARTDFTITEGVFHSEMVKRDVPYWAMVPTNNGRHPTPVVYFLHGRGGSPRQFLEVDGAKMLEAHVKNGGRPFAVIGLSGRVDNRDTYWVNEAQGLPWADMLLKEMIPALEVKYFVGVRPENRMLAGISMGSNGAFQLGLNSQGMFRCAAGHSIVVRDYDSASQQFPLAFGTRAEFASRDPMSLIKNYADRRQIPLQKVWIDIGKQDDPLFLRQARLFKRELARVGYSTDRGDKLDVDLTDGRHDDIYWKQRMAEYISWYDRCFVSSRR